MKYRKRPLVVSAVRFTGKDLVLRDWPSWLNDAVSNDVIRFREFTGIGGHRYEAYIKTREGIVEAKEGCYIIRGVTGEIYPCDELVFESTYDPIPDGEEKNDLSIGGFCPSEMEEKCHEAYQLWGPMKQIGKLSEECVECADASFKALKKYEDDPSSLSHLLEEICDVEIVCRQLHELFGENDHKEMMHKKLKKLSDAISASRKESAQNDK